jgi:hypothetical protein
MENKKIKISSGLKRMLKKSQVPNPVKFQDEFVANPENRNSYLESFSNALVVEIASNDY